MQELTQQHLELQAALEKLQVPQTSPGDRGNNPDNFERGLMIVERARIRAREPYKRALPG